MAGVVANAGVLRVERAARASQPQHGIVRALSPATPRYCPGRGRLLRVHQWRRRFRRRYPASVPRDFR
eukprot:11188340-Lingulodinium_polyedra.AAC.1